MFLTPQARQSQGESGFQVEAGQTVQLEGAMTALQESPEVAEGVESAEGADQLSSQGAYVRAERVSARLTCRDVEGRRLRAPPLRRAAGGRQARAGQTR